MTIKELSKAVYEDLNGRIVSVSDEEETYRIVFECDDWESHNKPRRFVLSFFDVPEATATPSFSGGVQVTDDHPLLWNHNEEHVSLFFSSVATNPMELMCELYEGHSRLLDGQRKLTDYLHADRRLLNLGHGLMAQGPRRVIEEYAKIIGDRLRYSIVQGYKPRGGYRVALFDECFVVFRENSVAELSIAAATG